MISLLSLLLIFSIGQAHAEFSCDALYDEFSIPHVEVKSEEEFYFCFGYHHGKDRAWEMDYFRRIAQGRNAEVLGFGQLKNDLMMRLLDMPSLAKKIWSEFPQENKQILEWYSRGVNTGMVTGKDAQEFKDLKYEPESWQPIHSLMVLLIQSFDQTKRTFFKDYEEERSKEKWGDKATQLFEQDDAPWLNTILKEGEYPVANTGKKKSLNKTTHNPRPELWSLFPEVFGIETGSNNWVVSKSRTKSGHAMLANDPHLDLLTPMFWYWIDLKSPQGQVIGASLPGVPTIPSGTNGKVAWGLTNAYINTADSVFVKDLPRDGLESFRPTVWVKFWFFKIPFFFKSFDRLKSGHPVLPLEIENDDPMVLRWTGFSLKPQDIIPMFDMYQVKDVAAMDEILKGVRVPAWNFVFADTKGQIGHRVIGKVFRHESKLAFGVPTMSYQDLQQEEYLTPEEVPHVLKPKRHYIYTANNRHWPVDAAFYGGRGYANSFRGFRIDQMLKSNSEHNKESFEKIQCDVLVVDARFFVPKLMKYLDEKPFSKWDQIARDESKELALYRRLMDLLMEKWQVNEYALFKLLDELTENEIKEFKQIYSLAKKEVNDRTWGEMHLLSFPHLSKDSRWKFAPEIAGVGDNHTVNPGTSKWNEDRRIYEQNNGASMRMIVEMSDKPRLYLALPGVNRSYSEKPKDSPWMNWKNCQYAEVKY